MNRTYQRLCEGAAAILERPLGREEADSTWTYLDLLESWNRVHRLVGFSDRDWMIENLVFDSLLFLRMIPEAASSLLDIGSGAGVPGVPIKIIRPGLSIVLAESRRKRASFLSTVVRTLGLTGAHVFHGRAESLVSDTPRFDAVVARCADKLEAVLDLGTALANPGGVVVVSGSPDTRDLARAKRLQIINPATGTPRTFVVASVSRAGE